MKNNKSIILGIIIIILVCIITVGCSFYDAIEPKDFKEHFGALGYTISETETPKYTTDTYLVASKDDVPFNIEYYEFKDESDAKKIYKKYKDSISDYITSDSKNKETTKGGISKIVALSDNEYIVISRVKNTLIFIASTKDYKEEIDTLLKNIKY